MGMQRGNSSLEVRHAVEDDVDWILQECKDFCEFFGTSKSIWDSKEKAEKILRHMLDNFLFFVCEHDGKPVGFISGVITPHPYNPDIQTLTESLWWVSEKHRGSRAGHLLFKEFVDWGQRNVDWIIATKEDHSPVSDSYFEKQGFKLKEKSFLLEVN